MFKVWDKIKYNDDMDMIFIIKSLTSKDYIIQGLKDNSVLEFSFKRVKRNFTLIQPSNKFYLDI